MMNEKTNPLNRLGVLPLDTLSPHFVNVRSLFYAARPKDGPDWIEPEVLLRSMGKMWDEELGPYVRHVPGRGLYIVRGPLVRWADRRRCLDFCGVDGARLAHYMGWPIAKAENFIRWCSKEHPEDVRRIEGVPHVSTKVVRKNSHAALPLIEEGRVERWRYFLTLEEIMEKYGSDLTAQGITPTAIKVSMRTMDDNALGYATRRITQDGPKGFVATHVVRRDLFVDWLGAQVGDDPPLLNAVQLVPILGLEVEHLDRHIQMMAAEPYESVYRNECGFVQESELREYLDSWEFVEETE